MKKIMIVKIVMMIVAYSSNVLMMSQNVEDSFAKLIAIRKQIKEDEKVYRQVWYDAYRKGDRPPSYVPSPAACDEERLRQQCIQHLQKTQPGEISKKRNYYAVSGTLLGMCTLAIPVGIILPLSESLSEFERAAGFVGKVAVYAGIVGGGLGYAFGGPAAEEFVLEQELHKRE